MRVNIVIYEIINIIIIYLLYNKIYTMSKSLQIKLKLLKCKTSTIGQAISQTTNDYHNSLPPTYQSIEVVIGIAGNLESK